MEPKVVKEATDLVVMFIAAGIGIGLFVGILIFVIGGSVKLAQRVFLKSRESE
jgi:hypothetical protein